MISSNAVILPSLVLCLVLGFCDRAWPRGPRDERSGCSLLPGSACLDCQTSRLSANTAYRFEHPVVLQCSKQRVSVRRGDAIIRVDAIELLPRHRPNLCAAGLRGRRLSLGPPAPSRAKMG